MREIKFRAWDDERKLLLDVLTIDFVNKMVELECPFDDLEGGNNIYRSAYGLIIDQYTGVKDRDGKEIYEGDIVRTGELPHEKHLVVYNPPCFDLKGYNEGDYYVGGCVNFWDWNQFEVIGNIHENPELLT